MAVHHIIFSFINSHGWVLGDECGYSKLGVSEEDLNAAERIFLEAAAFCSLSRKEEKVLGYSLEQIKREKALERLGVTQEQIELKACKTLGSLGFDGGGRAYNNKLCLPSDLYR